MNYLINLFFVATCLWSIPTKAALVEQSYFELGKKYFEQGDYVQSLNYLNNALSESGATPGIIYSIGSIHYKLKDYGLAHEYFIRLINDSKFGALSYYNLGLISHQQGDDALAVKYFKRSRSASKSNKHKELCSRQIESLTARTEKTLSAYMSAAYGYDSNVTSAPAGVASNKSGAFIQAIATGNLVVAGNRKEGVVVKGNLFVNNYFDSVFNDDDSITAALEFRHKWQAWRLAYGAGVKRSTYGADDFQKSYQLGFSAKNKLSKRNELKIKYRYDDISSLTPVYDYLNGDRHRFRVGYYLKQADDRYAFLYELELNDRQNSNNTLVPASKNYSPVRNKVSVRYTHKLNAGNTVGGDVTYRNSDYDATPTQDRSDKRMSVSVKYAHSLDKHWGLQAQVKYKNNDSNEPGDVFDYDRTVTTVSISRVF